jgi:hypothetical protein
VIRVALILAIALCAMGACEPVPEERASDCFVGARGEIPAGCGNRCFVEEHDGDLAEVPCSPPAEGVRL